MDILRSAISNIKSRFSGDSLAVVGLILVSAVIFITNFTPGTYLVGWDNVMPELGHKFNFLRNFTSVWQEYRGLGVIDIMGHGANLIHSLQIFLLDLILPENTVRFTFNIVMHLGGGLGMFFLGKKILKNTPLSFLASIFYMLNIGVIQMFFAPLEVFSVHFAALPWLTLTILNTLERSTKKSYLVLFLVSLLFLQQGFVPTLFLVFLIFLGILFIYSLLSHKRIKPIVLIALTIFAVNSIWLLPFIFATLSHASVIQSTRINEFSSSEIFFRNKEFGNIFDVLRGHGFMLNTIEYDTFSNQNIYFMQPFKDLVKNPFIVIFQSLIVITTLLGIIFAFIKRTIRLYPFIAIFTVSFFFLANNVFILEQLNNFVRQNVPLFGEAFRFPFTKFIIIFMFASSLLFAYGAGFLSGLIYQLTKFKFRKIVFGTTLFFSLITILVVSPVFNKNFFSPYLRLPIPEEYRQTFSYFNNEDKDKRILVLPMHTFWNWQYSEWGHRGSGFLWHGIEQPLLLRSFDPWSDKNEQLYNEFSYAINTQDTEQFNNLLSKYDISYILVDKNVVNTLSENPIKYDKLEEFLTNTNSQKTKDFDSIDIYKSKTNVEFVSLLDAKNIVRTSSSYSANFIDPLLKDTPNYILDRHDTDIENVFSSISTLNLPEDNEFNVRETEESFIISPKNFESNIKTPTLILPSIYKHEFLIPVKAFVSGSDIEFHPVYPDVRVNGKKIEVTTDAIALPSPLENPTEVTLVDTDHAIKLDNKDIGYLLNNIPNTIAVRNGVDEVLVRLDLTEREGNNSFVKLDEKIKSLEIEVAKGSGTLSNWNVIPTKRYEFKNPAGTLSKDKNSKSQISELNGVTMTTVNDAKTLAFYDKDLFHRGSYIVVADVSVKSGLRPNFFVDNIQAGRAETETKLMPGTNYIVVPPTDFFDQGYGFHITVKSEGTEEAKSTINRFETFPLPLQTLTNFRVFDESSNVFAQTQPQKQNVEFGKFGTFYYELEANPGSIIILSQSYSEGWKAYNIKDQRSKIKDLAAKFLPFIFGEEIKSHTLVNNWANGWELDSSNKGQSSIVIVYWPQYLQYIGYAMLVTALLIIAIGKKLTLVAFPFKRANDFFDARSERLKSKILTIKTKNQTTTPSIFPYEVNLRTNR